MRIVEIVEMWNLDGDITCIYSEAWRRKMPAAASEEEQGSTRRGHCQECSPRLLAGRCALVIVRVVCHAAVVVALAATLLCVLFSDDQADHKTHRRRVYNPTAKLPAQHRLGREGFSGRY
jgi:hypothetical protein